MHGHDRPMEANPSGYGVNWACPMDVGNPGGQLDMALRCWSTVREATTFWFSEVIASLVAHGRFLMENLEHVTMTSRPTTISRTWSDPCIWGSV